MSEFEEIEAIMKRIEDTSGTRSGKHLVKGTMMTKGDEIIRSSFDSTTSEALKTHFLGTFKSLCHRFVTELNPQNKIDFIRLDYKQKSEGRTSFHQIGMTTEGDCNALYMQEYRTRDLRIRKNNKDQRDVEGYLYIQRNPFNPTQD
jgi:hypothetical protein